MRCSARTTYFKNGTMSLFCIISYIERLDCLEAWTLFQVINGRIGYR